VDDRARAIRTARTWLKADPLFLDTETTGLDDQAGICELSFVDIAGRVLMDTLVRPHQPIPHEASVIHGITDAMAIEK
jgi:DNA polymerase-3 subunit epsilon